jgi:hypothetical protein
MALALLLLLMPVMRLLLPLLLAMIELLLVLLLLLVVLQPLPRWTKSLGHVASPHCLGEAPQHLHPHPLPRFCRKCMRG